MLQAHKNGNEADLTTIVNELEATFAKVIEHLNDARLNPPSEVAG